MCHLHQQQPAVSGQRGGSARMFGSDITEKFLQKMLGEPKSMSCLAPWPPFKKHKNKVWSTMMDEKDAEEKHRFPLRGGSCSGLQPFFIFQPLCKPKALWERLENFQVNSRHLEFLDHITIKGLVPTSTFQGNRPRTMCCSHFLGAQNKRLRCYADLLGHKSIGRPHYMTRNDTCFFLNTFNSF